MLYHDSHDERYREPLGPIKAGDKLTVRFACDEADNVTLRTWNGGESRVAMQRNHEGLFEATISLPDTPMLVWYDFIIHRADGDVRYGTSVDQLGGEGALCQGQPRSYQITVYDPAYDTPECLRRGVIYQIFPDRFFREKNSTKGRVRKIQAAHPDATFHEDWAQTPTLDIDPVGGDNRALDFFGGTLKGIRQKLDYLEALGVTVIYLNPVFRARTNHRYDTGDYEQIDPILGDEKDFEDLMAAAKARGMTVLIDGVFSHTGADSRYFNRYGRYEGRGAYQSEHSPYYAWYRFREFPDQYDCWWGFDNLPALDKNNPDYRRYLLDEEAGILPTWIRRGAGGWRLDVADELPMDLIAQMRSCVKQVNGQAVLLGEVWEDASNKISFGAMRSYCLGDTLDSVMNYPLRQAAISFFTGKTDAYRLRREILHQQEVYPAPFYYSLMNLLGSHDRVRILNAMCGLDTEGPVQMDREAARTIRLGKRDLKTAKKRYLEALKLLCALPGAPCVYYGDEIGMTGMADPWNRAPMSWDDMDEKLRDSVSELLHRRRETPVLQTGFLRVEAVDADTLRVTRYLKDGKDVFGAEPGGRDVTVRVSRK